MKATTYERECIARELRDALAAAQVTQNVFARLLGTSRTRLSAYLRGRTMPSAAFHQRALRTAAGLASAHSHGWMTPDQAASAIDKALASGDEQWAFKLAIQARDHVAEMLDRQDPGSDAWLFRAQGISDSRYEALLAALIEHEFERRRHQPSPEWTSAPHAESPWVHANARRGEAWTREHTPQWLAKRGVFISEHDLTTA